MPRKLSDFRLASRAEIEHALKPPKGSSAYSTGAGIFTGAPGGFHRSVIFKVMHETFGPPNGDAGEKSTWEWIIFTPAGLLSVYDYKGSWSIGYRGANIKPSKELIAEASALRDALIEEARKVHISKKQIKKSKVGGAILNPYALYCLTTEDLMNQANKIAEEIKSLQKEKDIHKFFEAISKSRIVASLYRAAFMTTFLSLEGFINLVYTLFLKDRYRNDIFEKRLRNEMLPIKILEMDVYCHSFDHPPLKEQDELFAALQHFINIRNLFLHANISDAMEAHLVKLDGYLVVTRSEVEEKYGITSDMRNLTNAHIIRANKLVRKLVVKVLQAMAEEVRYPFAIVHSHMWVEYVRKKPNSIYFPLRGKDYVPDSMIESILNESTELDKDYFDIGEEEFKPMFSKIL
ncbi:MAG: hypothetical protein DRN29_08750 [Thermoplasmata archaeon]|nr:MAG: hypothetical protein DRN29_08750 [Thermoplasmata archaeon]